MRTTNGRKPTETFAGAVGRALRRAGQTARKTARPHGPPIYIRQDGKVVPAETMMRSELEALCSLIFHFEGGTTSPKKAGL